MGGLMDGWIDAWMDACMDRWMGGWIDKWIDGCMGCGSVIILRPKMGVAPLKHDVISMPTQQCTNTKQIPIERYHPVVSIMLTYLDQITIFGENFCCRIVKIDIFFWSDLKYLLSNSTTFRNNCENKRSVRTKHISWLRKYKTDLGIQRADFEKPERPREELGDNTFVIE